ncbi:hypothetical protein J7T55_002175 [Diaporthe amygdali]|uniref:uncharacterized protein n=1 Tax=Phomopsis amygdali TaxID=1214568 RepID=UPI0022FE95FD|nr:uncharacterized protein J7T55_002175 [Diaporthe amygdali]KAJ0103843.1 hypothetical protein J7T55_002175 [Diaporthe amygdali]
MLPPVEDAVLQNNPEFAALYSTLCTVVLNPDGTTKDDKSQVAIERDAVRQVQSTKPNCPQAVSAAVPPEPARPSARTANKAAPQSPELPEPLLDLLLLLPPLLTSPEELPAETLQLLLSNPPFSSLEELIPDLASLVSSNLQSSAVQISRAAFPATNPSFVHRHVPSLARRMAELSSDLEQRSDSLAGARQSAANALAQLLQKHTEALTLLIRSLEAKHGGIARSLEHRAADVSLEAQLGQVNAETALWNVRKDVYSSEVREALRNYSLHLRDGQLRLREAMRTAQVELEDYGVAVDGRTGDPRKERALREAARAYRETRRQIEDAHSDLSRLR